MQPAPWAPPCGYHWDILHMDHSIHQVAQKAKKRVVLKNESSEETNEGIWAGIQLYLKDILILNILNIRLVLDVQLKIFKDAINQLVAA